MIVRTTTVMVVCLLLAGAGRAGAVTPQQKCQAKKNAAAGKYAACRENAEAKLASTGNTTTYDATTSKCEKKYQVAWQKAEQDAVDVGGSCTTTGDQAVVQAVTDEFTDDMAQRLSGATPTDCPTELATCNAGTAAAGDVLGGKTFSSSAGLGVAGTMPDNGAVTLTPGTSDQMIAAGYHNGAGKCAGDADLVSGNIRSGVNLFGVNGDSNVVNTSSGDAAVGDLLSGKIAWAGGTQVTGTMPNNGAVTLTPGTADQTIAAGYHNGSGKVVGDADLVSGNIKSGVNLFGVDGSPSVVETNSATAAAGDMLNGKTAYVNGSLVTGTVPVGSDVNGANGARTFTIPDGLYSSSKMATANDTNLVAGNIKSGATILGISGNVIQASGTATAADVLSGRTFSNASGAFTGTIPDNGAVTLTPGTTNQAIAAGYHNGAGYCAGDANLTAGNIKSGTSIFGVAGSSTVVDTGGTTAGAADMASGATAYVNGSLVTGTVPAGANVNGPNGSQTFTIPDGLYSGSKTATANDANLVGANIAKGVTILGVSGTALPAQPLRTGQTQCDQGAGTLGACPGSPAGQDGSALKGMTRSYTDNGDGTITDNRTGLMWEKLDDNNAGGIHDGDTTYTWYTAFTTKIATLNSTSFAGYNDWRLPNRFELETLQDLGRLSPSIDPLFNTSCTPGCTVATCSCTQYASPYWTSTTYQFNPVNAFNARFDAGTVSQNSKGTLFYVRAVRGGS